MTMDVFKKEFRTYFGENRGEQLVFEISKEDYGIADKIKISDVMSRFQKIMFVEGIRKPQLFKL